VNGIFLFEVPAKAVPGGIFTDLQNAGVLTGEFYYRFNDFDFRWVAHENWTYSCTFTLSAAAVASDVLVLDAQGNSAEVKCRGLD
jgi:beta-mannosidase